MSESQATPALAGAETEVAAISNSLLTGSALPGASTSANLSLGDQLGEAELQNGSFLSTVEVDKQAANSAPPQAAASPVGGSLQLAHVISCTDVSKKRVVASPLSVPDPGKPPKFRNKGVRGLRSTTHAQGRRRDPRTLSVLDLAAVDLEQLRTSFIAHAQAFGRSDFLDLYKVAGDVAREMHYADREAERLQRRGQASVPPRHSRRQNDAPPFCTSPQNSGEEGAAGDSTASVAEDSIANLSMSGSCIFAKGLSSQKARLLSVWLYDHLVVQELFEFKNMSLDNPRDTHDGVMMLSPRSFLESGTKAMMVKLRGPPTPQQLAAFDIFDGLSLRLQDHTSSAALEAANMSIESLSLPFPVFVYVLSRAVFRMCYLDCFPKGTFSSSSSSTTTTAGAASTTAVADISFTSAADIVRKECFTTVSKGSHKHDSLLQEVANLLEECRHVVIRFFELLDSEQQGVITWSAFTDLLMERVEVQHRLMMVKESSELNVRSDARALDEHVLEPFPSVMQRLGYVRAVIEVRYSRSAIIVEGPHDFAVCDSAYSSLIQHKLLVRSAYTLFAHRKGAPDEWGAERWEVAAQSATSAHPERKHSRKIVRYEDGRGHHNETASKVLKKRPACRREGWRRGK
ncbi:hypothetical protein TraAM80_07328 [Trypanosoma rangeli]|uniref:Uncharacterized protein n=1 Tax=Trypanosoma rangeli TaxID=5698 RepID=A0A422N626_TRYRA|nr:uncharacterized protein TraAM80_07328 [Trypanosoma rangeli]RNF00909.1 hypothetical protein TraAM80_07328 [Trypanosoma rangeli]|eukprot:RNF00909.1 hypothetical protein TraAM80_07328 [Trypanosoma rangeli]